MSRLAKWDGSSWSKLDSELSSVFPTLAVDALTVHDDGSGLALYAGGRFTHAGGQLALRVAKWNGSAWSPVGSGIEGGASPKVSVLTVYDDGSGPALYAGGWFTLAGGQPASHIAKWDGSAWSPLGGGLDAAVHAIAGFDDGSGPSVYVGGEFVHAGGLPAGRIARWNGSTWPALPTGLNGEVRALAVYDAGSGPALYAGGLFGFASGRSVGRIARWNGHEWSPLGSGMNDEVYSLVVFDDGSGPALYAGGKFTVAGGQAANRIAKWNGSTWSPLGSGLTGHVNALRVYDDGSGPALYVGGSFLSAGGQAANGVARWDGNAWSSLAGGFHDQSVVCALAEFDDGSGPALYAGGQFSIPGVQGLRFTARWDGVAWSQVGTGSWNGVVYALTVYDDGSGSALYAGGQFTTAAGQPAHRITKWDGSTWSALGIGLQFTVHALTVHDDGSGPALFAGGSFSSSGSQVLNYIAKWDGSAWAALENGITGNINGTVVRALTVFDDGSGAALYPGGEFTVSPAGDSFVAKWGCAPSSSPGTAFCSGDGSGSACPCGNDNDGSNGVGGCANSAGAGGGLLTATGTNSIAAGDLVLSGSTLQAGQAGLYLQGNNATGGGNGVAFGDGLRCAGGAVVRLQVRNSGMAGASFTTVNIPAVGGVNAGDIRRYQLWFRDTAGPCGSGFNFTNGYEVTWAP